MLIESVFYICQARYKNQIKFLFFYFIRPKLYTQSFQTPTHEYKETDMTLAQKINRKEWNYLMNKFQRDQLIIQMEKNKTIYTLHYIKKSVLARIKRNVRDKTLIFFKKDNIGMMFQTTVQTRISLVKKICNLLRIDKVPYMEIQNFYLLKDNIKREK